jgi:hypothetical protein
MASGSGCGTFVCDALIFTQLTTADQLSPGGFGGPLLAGLAFPTHAEPRCKPAAASAGFHPHARQLGGGAECAH